MSAVVLHEKISYVYSQTADLEVRGAIAPLGILNALTTMALEIKS